MINIIETNTPNLLYVEITDKVTKEEVQKCADAALEIIENEGSIRALMVLRDFHGYTVPAFFEDFKFCMSHLNDFSHMAIVGDNKLEEFMASLSQFFMKGEIKYFDIKNLEKAKNWVLKSPARV